MRLDFSPHFLRSYHKAPEHIQRAFDKQALRLLENLRHPSLRAKKYDEGQDLWQGRVTGAWRFYFKIAGDTYQLEEIKARTQSKRRRAVLRFLQRRCDDHRIQNPPD
jgi:mRNA-degrading endonuclease RelE of RelBE toxin-antitoxin system